MKTAKAWVYRDDFGYIVLDFVKSRPTLWEADWLGSKKCYISKGSTSVSMCPQGYRRAFRGAPMPRRNRRGREPELFRIEVGIGMVPLEE